MDPIKGAYYSPEYCKPERFASYARQIGETLSLSPESVLEIGIGNSVVSTFLRGAGIPTVTMDLCPDLRPDIAASVAELPFREGAFDTVLCFEVLEHLPFDLFSQCLSEIRRICRRHTLLSLPHSGRYYTLIAKLPRFYPNIFVEAPYIFPPVHTYDGRHYWEIGKRDYPLQRITAALTGAGYRLDRYYRIPEHPYNAMFVLSSI
ncbi:MAG: class I SAM-dependent methyltransferase [Candidatus Latescibacterota bacterium]